ncbi:MAG TPA: lytic transglycosylase domain-containing protein [Rubricoccaceae bacterium]|nr:lytic transglycosylase domain-containing protein [Rubricoccaceae bacterium]
MASSVTATPVLVPDSVTVPPAAPHSVLPAPMPPAPGATPVQDWPRRVVALRRTLLTIEQAERRSDNATAHRLADEAFAEARALAADRGAIYNEHFRALYLRAQAAYERHHGGVRPVALSADEFARLRGASLADFDDHGRPVTDVPGGTVAPEPEVEAAPAIPAILAFPPEMERLIQQQSAVMSRSFGGFRGVRARGRRLFPMIDRALRARGLPTELKYVAVIESGLSSGAVSSAGAIGLWQLMPGTGAMYGLDSTAIHNPTRATNAAVRHLQRLGRMFNGDWQLALAAYNWGPARVQGLVARHRRRLGRTPTYWDIHRDLPRETREYVPRFIAVARALGG